MALLAALSAAIAGAALMDYRIAQEYNAMRSECLVAGFAAGVGLCFTMGGAIHYVMRLLNRDGPILPGTDLWYTRLFLVLLRHLFYFVQAAGAALAVACIAAVLFDLTIPGPDYSMLYRGGYTPPLPPPMNPN
jgi:hypothetical protein